MNRNGFICRKSSYSPLALPVTKGLGFREFDGSSSKLDFLYIYIYIYIYTEWPKICIHSLLINIFGINLNEISISG